MNNADRSVLVIGAGPVGALAGLLFAQRGFQVDIYEQRPAQPSRTYSVARAINLSLSPRGIKALQEGKIDAHSLDCIVPMKGRILHFEDGHIQSMSYGDETRRNLSISRERLNSLLLERAAALGARVHFGTRCVGVAAEQGQVELESAGQRQTRRASLIIGADGARSAVREALAASGALASSLTTAALGYKELTLGLEDRWFPFSPEAIHIWPRRGFFMVALPNRDGTLRATLVMPLRGDGPSFERVNPSQIMARFRRDFADAALHAHHLEQEYEHNPTGHILLAHASRYAVGRIFLAGDAAHAMAPFLGQGVNAGLEDIASLVSCVDHTHTIEQLAQRYDAVRRPEGEAAAALSLLNYDELARREQRPRAVLTKRLRAMGHQLAPALIDPPLTTLINFLDLPYTEVLRRCSRANQAAS